ncbi:MAG: site-2 protease family protein [Bacteroidota bacterium]
MEEQNDQINQQEEGLEEFENEDVFYPPKPEPSPATNKLIRSVISSALFILLSYFFLDWELVFIFKLICVLLIHEMGHYAAMHRFNYNDLSIFFIPLVGAVATGEKEEVSLKQQVIILLAGPVPGIIIGVLLYAASIYLKNDEFLSLSMIFIFLNVFNLLPFTPLDGGKILKALFFENNMIISAVFSVLSAVGLAIIAISLNAYIMLILPLFILLQLNAGYAIFKLSKVLKSKNLPTDTLFSELSNKHYWQIRDEMGLHLNSMKRFISPGVYEPAVNEDQIINTMKQLVRKKPVNDLSLLGKAAFLILWIGSILAPLVGVIVLYGLNQSLDL